MKYRVRCTKTKTVVSTAETIVDIPVNDLAKAQAYIEVARAFGDYDTKNPLCYLHWQEGPPVETFTVDVYVAPEDEAEAA